MTTANHTTCTTCPYCGVGCGVSVTLDQDQDRIEQQVLPVAGDTAHPSNFGKLCVKGSALHDTLDHTDRLLYPSIHGKRASWDESLQLVADTIADVVSKHGPEAVAMYAAGQILTEDYYVANKLMKGFIGSGNLDTNSRLCMASAVVAYKRALGSDTVPGCYEDLELADLLVLVGSNAAWAHPILYQRMAAAKAANPHKKVVVIDPRKTATCDFADLHLAIRPGTDVLLFNALLAHLAQSGKLDQAFIDANTEHFDQAIEAANAEYMGLEATAQQLDIAADDLQTFFDWFGDTEKALSFYSQGVNQARNGSDKGNAIINVHLATGKIGKPGAAPFSITGQPNAMGGREVGGLANQLAAHMDFADADRDRIQRFWQAPNLISGPGLKAVDLFDAIKDGKIKFLWVVSTNPLVSLPDADDVKAAIKACDLVVVSDCMANTDTAELADVLLPAASWGEKNGTVTNSERRISRQRNFIKAPGEAMPDWWAMTQVANKLGFEEAFGYQHPAEIFDEHTRLTGFENGSDGHAKRDLDLSGLSGMSREQYDNLTPVQWPVNSEYPNGRARFYDDGHFYTPTGKARFVPVSNQLPESAGDGELVMNTGRVRDHWHTMTRTAKSARLAQHISEPYVDVHPDDAEQYGLKDDQIARLFNQRGDILMRTRIRTDQRKGEVFVPMHWTDRYASKARMGTLIAKTRDPFSGQPELKYTLIKAEPAALNWQGMLLSRSDLGKPPCDYWAYGLNDHCHGYELAGNQTPADMANWLRQQLPHSDCQWQEMRDDKNQHLRLVAIREGRIEAVMFCHPQLRFESRQWLQQCFDKDTLETSDRRALLAGRPVDGVVDQGKMVCSCFGVCERPIMDAIMGGCCSVEGLGEALKCGTNCGSCVPELRGLIEKHKDAATALAVEA